MKKINTSRLIMSLTVLAYFITSPIIMLKFTNWSVLWAILLPILMWCAIYVTIIAIKALWEYLTTHK